MPYRRYFDTTVASVETCGFVFPYTVLSAISFFESRQETGNYMELTRVDNFTMLGSGVSERCNGGDEQASLVTVVAQSVELAAGTT